MGVETTSERTDAWRRRHHAIALNGGHDARSPIGEVIVNPLTGKWHKNVMAKCSLCPAEIPEGVRHWIGDAPICKACIPTATAEQVRA